MNIQRRKDNSMKRFEHGKKIHGWTVRLPKDYGMHTDEFYLVKGKKKVPVQKISDKVFHVYENDGSYTAVWQKDFEVYIKLL